MPKTRITFLMIFSVALLLGCGENKDETIIIIGSGNVVTQEEDITDFESVEFSDAFQTEVTRGDNFRVFVRIDDNLLQYLQVVKTGDTLRIDLEDGNKYEIKKDNTTLEAEVTMPELFNVNLSSAVSCHITGFKSAKALAADLSGASSLHGDIEAGDAHLDLSGASSITLSGSANDLVINADDASQVDMADFLVANANVEANNASKVTVNTNGNLDVRARSASHVYYLGNPTLGNIDTDGASSVEPR